MIKMKMVTGPFAGRKRDVSNQDPIALLQSCVVHDWAWALDYSMATSDEKTAWGRADIAVRSVRALMNGMSVTFQGSVYKATPENLQEIVGILEDAIVNSGTDIQLVADDEYGVVIIVVAHSN